MTSACGENLPTPPISGSLTPRPQIGSTPPLPPKADSDSSLGGTGLRKEVGGLCFDSSFDSANLLDVTLESGEFQLVIARDCEGTEHQTRNSSWFHFSVSGATAGSVLRLRMVNMNRQPGLYRQGLRPVVKSLPSKPDWERIKSELDIVDNKEENRFEVAWKHPVASDGETAFFAFTYPFGYDEVAAQMAAYEEALASPPPRPHRTRLNDPNRPAQKGGVVGGDAGRAEAVDPGHWRAWGKWVRPVEKRSEDIFFHREILTRSLDGRRVDLLTISDWTDLLDDEDGEDDGETDGACVEPAGRCGVCESHVHMYSAKLLGGGGLDSCVFPEVRSLQRPHAPQFATKRYCFLTARVHPGETPASYSLEGALGLLLHPTDLRAAALRRHFVFKVVPILNPDGVARGHYRQDNLGANLNRFYVAPLPATQPTIYAAKQAVRMHAFMPSNKTLLHGKAPQAEASSQRLAADAPGESALSVAEGKEAEAAAAAAMEANRGGRVALYVDFHAHATKRGCFIYGNSMPSLTDQVENQLFACLLAVNSAHFDYEGCDFSKKHMEREDKDGQTAEGSGRVAMYVATGLVHSYTLECNYNSGKVVNAVPAAQGGRCSPARPPPPQPVKYGPAEWREVGRGVLASLLDLRGLNPWSRVGNSRYKTVDRCRNLVCGDIRNEKQYRKQSLAQRRDEANAKSTTGGGGGGGASHWSKAPSRFGPQQVSAPVVAGGSAPQASAPQASSSSAAARGAGPAAAGSERLSAALVRGRSRPVPGAVPATAAARVNLPPENPQHGDGGLRRTPGDNGRDNHRRGSVGGGGGGGRGGGRGGGPRSARRGYEMKESKAEASVAVVAPCGAQREAALLREDAAAGGDGIPTSFRSGGRPLERSRRRRPDSAGRRRVSRGENSPRIEASLRQRQGGRELAPEVPSSPVAAAAAACALAASSHVPTSEEVLQMRRASKTVRGPETAHQRGGRGGDGGSAVLSNGSSGGRTVYSPAYRLDVKRGGGGGGPRVNRPASAGAARSAGSRFGFIPQSGVCVEDVVAVSVKGGACHPPQGGAQGGATAAARTLNHAKLQRLRHGGGQDQTQARGGGSVSGAGSTGGDKGAPPGGVRRAHAVRGGDEAAARGADSERARLESYARAQGTAHPTRPVPRPEAESRQHPSGTAGDGPVFPPVGNPLRVSHSS